MNMNKERFLAENQVLASKVPSSAYRFIGIGTSSPYLRIAARTNNGHIYTLHFDLRGFPESSPKVFVTKMLKDRSCNDMSGASGSMHTLCSEHGWTRICHYGQTAWTPYVSLFKVYVKCCLWLNMCAITRYIALNRHTLHWHSLTLHNALSHVLHTRLC